MKAVFRHARTINGKHYSPGAHELPDELENHWFVQGLIKARDLVVSKEVQKTEEPVTPPVETETPKVEGAKQKKKSV